MGLLDPIIEQARVAPQRIVLSEGEDARIIEGALRATNEGIARPLLVGQTVRVEHALVAAGARPDALPIIDPASSELTAGYATCYHELRAHKGMDEPAALAAMQSDPLVFAAMMVRQGDADATIGGAAHTTGDTVRAALQIIGRAEGVNTVSSFFIMLLQAVHHGKPRALLFADCALIVQPSVEELTQIALSTANSWNTLIGNAPPRVAMLSFSTAGSARHKLVSRVAQATAEVGVARPDLKVDGDIQFDAAFVPDVAMRKAPDSPLQGEANIMVFPGLESANIGYKIAQRVGGAEAIGPILQGLARPANDLSRGCNAEDVFKLMAVTGVQAAGDRH